MESARDLKILVVGDPHCKISSIGEIDLLREEVLAIAKRVKLDLVVIAGDLLNDHEKTHVLAYNAAVKLLSEVSAVITTVYVLGNHDMVNNSGFLHQDHFFQAMKLWDPSEHDLWIVDEPLWLRDGDLWIEHHFKPDVARGMLFVPFVPPGRFMEAVTKCPHWTKARAIFAHQEFKGASMGAIESKHGDEWPEDAPLVISGHIHPYQRLGKNIIYPGTPYQTGFGENEKKTVSLFTFPLKGEPTEERIPLSIPRKETLKVTVADLDTLELPEGSTIRLSIEGTTAELAALKKTKKYKELEKKCKVICKPVDPDQKIESIKRQSYLDLLKEACATENDTVKKVFDEVTQK